jgi:hypothetical protein
MKTDITRQVSASVYNDAKLRDKIYHFVQQRYNSVVQSYGFDVKELLKHVFNARKGERNYFKILFLPALVFWILIILILASQRQMLGGPALLILILVFVIIFSIISIRDIKLIRFLKTNLYKNSYISNFDFNSSNSKLIDEFLNRMSDNVVFYSGYSPFVGSGTDIGGWSFVIDIDKGKSILDNRLQPDQFELSEMYNVIENEINGLNIPNLSITEKVFINGKNIRDNRDFLPNVLGCPVNKISQQYVYLAINNNLKDARFYKVIQVVDWDGDLILTSFLRLQKNEKSLFVENNYYLLPPISSKLKSIDTIKESSGFKHFIGFIIGVFFKTIIDSLVSLFKVLGYINETISKLFGGQSSVLKKTVKTSPDYDYGAETSIREAISQTQYSQHFQKLDKERYFKMIEKRIFNLIGNFLDSKNIDASEFKERETSILNQGVIVTGGNINSENIAVGKGSRIKSK